MPNVAVFLSYVLMTSFTPGPNNIMSMSNASRYGFRKSILFNVGVFWGFFCVINLCSLFSVTLYRLIPSVRPAMTCLGAAYILWLAWKTYRSKPAGAGPDDHDKRTNTFWSGLILQFVNPKVILYGVTTVSTFIVPYYKTIPALAGFSVFLAFVGFVATCCWSLFGSVFQRFLLNNDTAVNTVMALLLVYCAVSLFL